MDINYQYIGSQIKALREQQHISQESLAEKCCLSVQHISNIEHANTKLSLNAIKTLSTALGSTIDFLVTPSSIHYSPYENEVLKLMDNCDEYEQKMMVDVLRAMSYNFKTEKK